GVGPRVGRNPVIRRECVGIHYGVPVDVDLVGHLLARPHLEYRRVALDRVRLAIVLTGRHGHTGLGGLTHAAAHELRAALVIAAQRTGIAVLQQTADARPRRVNLHVAAAEPGEPH